MMPRVGQTMIVLGHEGEWHVATVSERLALLIHLETLEVLAVGRRQWNLLVSPDDLAVLRGAA